MNSRASRPKSIDRHTLHTGLRSAAQRLSESVAPLRFESPITHVYNPLDYAWELHSRFIDQAAPSARVLFLGMNPGPWGMAQTGVPFGEVAVVRDWMQLRGEVTATEHEHPKRPIQGLACARSEVSGRRLWGLMQDRFQTPAQFFQKHYVLNYCPLVFMEASGRNRTPDKLPAPTRAALQAHCDEHLREVLSLLPWKHLVGVGAFAETCLRRVLSDESLHSEIAKARTDGSGMPTITRILHPSPASPAANRDWSGTVTKQLEQAGVW